MLRRTSTIALALLALVGVGWIWRTMLGALLIRFIFQADAAKTKRAMLKHAAAGIQVERGVVYSPDSRDARLDIYRREDAAGPAPTLVWVHGGAWLSGHRDDAAPYFTLLAEAGYTVVSIGYSRAPVARYPTPLRQLAEGLGYLVENADEVGVDGARLALAGDSAGAQIISQMAAIISDPKFAAEVGVTVSLRPESLRAILLFCGIFDIRRFLDVSALPSRTLRWGVRETVRAYTGGIGPESSTLRQMSTIDHITPSFPPTFVSGGNGDRLTDTQSRPLAAALREKGVEVETLFFAEDHDPALPHEYQFKLDTDAGQIALRRTLDFLQARLSP